MTPGELIFETDTQFGHYQVYDMVYEGRAARVLYSGHRQAAQSGIPADGNQPVLLFDYNQRLFELATYLQPQRVLIIGGGTYTLSMALLAELPRTLVEIVELDPDLDEIAHTYFGWQPNRRQKIYHQDGRKFLEQSTEHYDLIILDAFESQAAIPAHLLEPEAVKLYRQHLKTGGVFAANVIAAYLGERSTVLRQLAKATETTIGHTDIFPAGRGVSAWLPQNFVLIAQSSLKHNFQQVLRYSPLDEASDN
ncbi:MAG TPA: fused MFS/spermidine synthase [Candidatus Saccharimonadales bacterium]|nr:fused MFS/spermidine synthase [Candidatus Saccharimonadales bacterium]